MIVMKNDKNFLWSLFSSINKFLNLLFGHVTWQKPTWLLSIVNFSHEKARLAYTILIISFASIICLISVLFWYQHLPKPITISASITAPAITPLADTLTPAQLLFDFGTTQNETFSASSVAPLANIGKAVTNGITMDPPIAGQWTWNTDSELIFKPSEDWPAGQNYQVKFDKSVFAPHLKFATYKYEFATLPFTINIDALKFYQDITNPTQTRVVGTVSFNFPVDTQSLEQHSSLILNQIKTDQINLPEQRIPLSFTYDKFKRTAYINSALINLPTIPRHATFIIGSGTRSASNTTQTSKEINQSVLIPDVGSFLQLNKVDTTIARDENDNPQQLIIIESSLGVSTDELTKHIHVYLLPKDMPATSSQPIQPNYEWRLPGEVTDAILNGSTPVNITALPDEHPYPNLHSWQISELTPRYLYIKIDAGVKGLGGFTLTHSYQTVVSVPTYPQEIRFIHKGSLISLSDEKKLTILDSGLPLVKFSVARVLPGEINHLISQTSGNFDNPTFLTDSFTSNDLSQITSEKVAFNIETPNDQQYATIDLNKYLTKANQLGLFLITAQGWDKDSDTATETGTSRLILITDMGLLVKNNADGTHDVFVQSISKGTPVAGATVSLLGRNGLSILSGSTDNNGHVYLSSTNDFSDDQEPTVYVVQKENDISFIPFNRDDRLLNYSRFDIGGVNDTDNNSSNLSAYLFSDRGIYRPGDKIHFGIIVKQQYAQFQPAGLPLEEEITNPSGNSVFDQKVNLSDSGLMTLDYQPDATAQTGMYTANLYLVKDNQKDSLLGSTQVKVAEFLPDRLKMQTQFISANSAVPAQITGWISPTNLTAKVNLWNLFGTAATNRRVSAKIVITPTTLHFAQYPQHIFVDPLLDPQHPLKTFVEQLSDDTTNDQGIAQFNLNLQNYAQAIYQLTFFAQGFEAQGGRGVSNQSTALVTPLNYLIGYKPDGNLDYIKQNSAHTVNLIAINADLKQIPLTQLQEHLFSIQTVATLTKNPDDTYAYKSIKTEQAIAQQPFTIDAKGSDLTIPTQQVGDFAMTLTDQQGHLLTKFYYSIVGQSSNAIEKNAELSVKLDKAIYNPGDLIQLQITSPYTGAGLITIERDKVYAYQWFNTNLTNSVETIRIPPNLRGDAYINVAFVRDWNSNEIYMSPLSYGVVPFSITHDDQTVHVKLSTANLVKPGDNLAIQYQTDKPAKIILFAVDQGILQVTHFTTPDPIAYYFQKHALTVTTSQIVDQIMPKYIASRENSAFAGDGEEKSLAANLNPFKRNTEAPVVYWSGILDSDNTARTINYTVPDYFNGNLQVMAVAVAASAVGNAEQHTLVRGDFVISPNVPTFVAPDDAFTVSASIANNIKGSGNTTATAISLSTTAGLTISGANQQQLIIPEGQERSVQFNLMASHHLGNATLYFQAKQGNKMVNYKATLSVRPAVANQTTVMTGLDNSNNKSVAITRQLYPEYRVLQASASTNPLILADGLQSYLNNYPYYCTEQLVSTAFAQLALAKQPLFKADPTILSQKMNATLQMLRQRLNSDGGFNYWPATTDQTLNNFSTVYAVDYLTEAKLEGYAIPDDLLQSGLTYLKNMANQDINDLDQARLDAYAIYLLTRNEIVTTDYVTQLQTYLMNQQNDQWRHDITSVYLAATYKLLQNDDEANQLIKGYSLDNPVINPSDFNNNLTNNAQYMILLARHFPDQLQKLGSAPILAIAKDLGGEYFDTLSSAYSVNALSAYAQMNSAYADSGLSISEKLSDGGVKDLSSINSQYALVNFDPQVQQIVFHNPNHLQYFYQVKQSGFDLSLPTQALNNHLEVFREYRDMNKNTIQQTAIGSDIESHLQIRSLDNLNFDNVAIVDLLPGGFEVVPGSINQQNCSYVDVREDRVIFYCMVSPNANEISYKLRATNIGNYTVPPIFAQDMYNQTRQSVGVAGKINVH